MGKSLATIQPRAEKSQLQVKGVLHHGLLVLRNALWMSFNTCPEPATAIS